MSKLTEVAYWVLVAARALALIAVPFNLSHVSLWLVLARPSGEVLMLASSDASKHELIAVWICAVASRVLFDLTVFRIVASHGSRIVVKLAGRRGARAVAVGRRVTRGWLLVLCVFYSTTPVVTCAALSRLRFSHFLVANALGAGLISASYLLIGLRVRGEIDEAGNWLAGHQGPAVLLASLGVATIMIGTIRRRHRQDGRDDAHAE
ncbi:DedA family protein [Kribbella sp. NPDC004138]